MSNHELNSEEIELSAHYSKILKEEVILFKDGHWICESFSVIGTGPTVEDAVEDFKSNNQ